MASTIIVLLAINIHEYKKRASSFTDTLKN
nr:MAG TPA: hypothetical protein [Bacteriophage sp.]